MWPEAIRVVSEARPRWCLFENPPGIYDVGIDGILADLEGIGYETGIVEIPACAKNSPQRRARVWIVANATNAGFQYLQSERGISEKETPFVRGDIRTSQGDVADRDHPGRERRGRLGKPAEGWEAETNRRYDTSGSDKGDVAHAGSDTKRTNQDIRSKGIQSISENIGNGSQGDVADTGTKGYQDVQLRGTLQKSGRSAHDTITECAQISNFWSSYLWTPCADGKLRRTPDYPVIMANGVQSGLPETLGEGEKATWPTPKTMIHTPNPRRVEILKQGKRTFTSFQGQSGGINALADYMALIENGEDYQISVPFHRSILAALGNSIVPQVAYEIIKAIKEADD